ncbi:MAG TPA: hypothetical protein V6D17_00710 [Candidatus Obscuribacterales bacterium]
MSSMRAKYGSWASPIKAADIAGGTIRLEQVMWDGDDLYWLEGRPRRAVAMSSSVDRRREKSRMQFRLRSMRAIACMNTAAETMSQTGV